jgi:tryptophan-rich sensory protein
MENIAIWYQSLTKPFWAPEVWVFGVVWSFLYVVIFLTLVYLIFFQKNKNLLMLYISNIIMNLLY